MGPRSLASWADTARGMHAKFCMCITLTPRLGGLRSHVVREHAVGILGSTRMSINHAGQACIACDYHSMSMSMGVHGSLSAVLCAGLPMWRGILQGYGRQFRVTHFVNHAVVVLGSSKGVRCPTIIPHTL